MSKVWHAAPVATALTVATALLSAATFLLGAWAPSDLIDCASPKLVIKRHEVVNALLSPVLLRPGNVSQVFAHAVALALLALVEVQVGRVLKSKRAAWWIVLGTAWVAVVVVRTVLGYVFSRSVGWAYPSLFVSDAMHECNSGMCPTFLAVSLGVLPLWAAEDVVLRATGKTYSIKAAGIVSIPLALGCFWNDIVWWNMSGILVGLALLVLTVTVLVPAKPEDTLLPPLATKRRKRLQPASPVLMSSVVVFCIAAVLARHLLKAGDAKVAVEQIAALRGGPSHTLLVTIFLSAPRKYGAFLKETMDSYLRTVPRPSALMGAYRFMVFSGFGQHDELTKVRKEMSHFTDLRWIVDEARDLTEPGVERQRHDFGSALMHAVQELPARYYMLVEDDFPLCEGGWDDINRLLVLAHEQSPRHCGLFVGTGGSGLIFKREMVEDLNALLISSGPGRRTENADLIIQKCLRGVDEKCLRCANTLVTSKTMIMKHVGFNASTTMHAYTAEQYQCHWRQPFNGEVDVVTI